MTTRCGGDRSRCPVGVRFRVRGLLAATVFCALVLALVAQHRRHANREAAWDVRGAEQQKLYKELNGYLIKSQLEYQAKRKMGFGQVTLSVLEAPTRIETLAVVWNGESEAATEEVVTLTGEKRSIFRTRPTKEIPSQDFAGRLAAFLLDTNNYLLNGSPVVMPDAPEPRFGFRLERGSAVLDVLFSLENSYDPTGHADLFLQVRTRQGELLEQHGGCMFNASLVEMLAPGRR